MARVRSLVRGLVSSYALLGAMVVYGLASVPVALEYLTREEFGLWAIVMQFVAYLTMLDFGMTGSVGRFIIDQKDEHDRSKYGALLATGTLILALQGALLLLIGYFLAPWFARISYLPEPLYESFVTLMRAQCLIAAIGFPTRIFSQILYAHQRLDAVNASQILFFIGGLASMWLGFHFGAGIYSLLWSSIFGLVQSTAFTYVFAKRSGLLPGSGIGRVQWIQAVEMFRYGRDVFLVSLGTQLMTASQPVILARNFGLEAVATWSVGTRIFGLANQLVWKISDVAAPGLAEMMIRDEKAQLEHRYKQVAVVSIALAGWTAITLCQLNSLFVSVWTQNALSWSPRDDIFLGMWMISLAIGHSHNGFILVTKQVAGMKWVFVVEGLCFILIAATISVDFSDRFSSILKTSALTSALLSGTYGAWRIAHYFKVSLWRVMLLWPAPMVVVVVIYGCAATILWNAISAQSEIVRLIIHLAFSLTVGLTVFVRFGIPLQLRNEIWHRLYGVFPRRLLQGMRRPVSRNR